MKQAFALAVEAHGATVLRVCRALLAAEADAEDAWSETFLAALQAWPELPAETRVEAWLVRVAQRKAIDLLRARRRQPLPLESVAEPVAEETVPDVDHAAIWAAVDRLPRRQRLAVAWHYLAGMSYPEVAALCGGSADAARRAGNDGIRTLRRQPLFLPQHWQDEERER